MSKWATDIELAALETWLREGGGTLGPVRVRTCEAQGRGLFATRAVSIGELLLRVPEALILTDEYASTSPLGRSLRAALPSVSASEQVCVQLVHHRLLGHASEWAAWLATVPEQYDSLPAWEAAQLDSLGTDLLGAPLRAKALKEHGRLRERHAALCAALAAAHGDGASACAAVAKRLSWRAFCSAWCAVQSRAASIGCGRGEAVGLALVPMGDLFNHRAGAPTDARFVRPASGSADAAVAGTARGRGHYEYRAAYALAAGDEVCVQYGSHSNEQLLCLYGFALAHNASDTLALAYTDARVCARSLELAAAPAMAALAAKREQALLACGLSAGGCLLSAAEPLEAAAAAAAACSAAGTQQQCIGAPQGSAQHGMSACVRFELPWRVLTFARVATMSEAELGSHWRVLGGEALSADNERAALSWLRSECARMLAGCPGEQGGARAKRAAGDGRGAEAMITLWRQWQLWLLAAYHAEAAARLAELESSAAADRSAATDGRKKAAGSMRTTSAPTAAYPAKRDAGSLCGASPARGDIGAAEGALSRSRRGAGERSAGLPEGAVETASTASRRDARPAAKRQRARQQ